MVYLSLLVSLPPTLLAKAAPDPPTFMEGVHRPRLLMGGASKNSQPFIKTPCSVWPCQMGLQAGFGQNVAGSISEGRRGQRPSSHSGVKTSTDIPRADMGVESRADRCLPGRTSLRTHSQVGSGPDPSPHTITEPAHCHPSPCPQTQVHPKPQPEPRTLFQHD